ncbi:MAG: hypothetical protein ACTTIC_01240 [Helicobacteraceae bacterium]
MMNGKFLISSVTAGLIFASCGGGDGGSSAGANSRVGVRGLYVAQDLNITWDRKTVFDNIGEIRLGEDNWYKPFGFSYFGNVLDLATTERVVSLSAKNNFIIAASAYHNALSVIDYASDEKEHKYTKFASFRINHNTKRGGLAISGSDGSGGIADLDGGSLGSGSNGGAHVDSSSGASSRSVAKQYADESCRSLDKENEKSLWEHKMDTARITADGRYVYALIKPRLDDAFNPRVATYGIFRAMTGYCGVNPHDAKSTNKIDSRGVELIELSRNDKMLAVYGKGKIGADEINTIRIYNNTLTKILATQRVDSVRSFDFAFGDTSIVGVTDSVLKMDENGSITQSPKIFKRSLPDLKRYREANLPFLASTVLGTKDRAIAISNERGFVALFDANLKMLKEIKVQLEIGERISHASVSPNGKYLALARHKDLLIYETTGSDFIQVAGFATGRVRALTFVNDATIAYTPFGVIKAKLKDKETKVESNVNSVVTLRLSKLAPIQDDADDEVQSQAQILDLGEFAKDSITKTHGGKWLAGKTHFVSMLDDALLAFRELGEKEKGYSLLKPSGAGLEIADGSTAHTAIKLGDSNELVGFKLIDQSNFVTLEKWKGLTRLYVKKIDGGRIVDVSEAAGATGIPYDVKFSKDGKRIFSVKKQLTDQWLAPSAKGGKEIYLVDVYARNGYSIDTLAKEIPMDHMQTHENAIAINDDGSEIYSIGAGRLYKHHGDFKSTEPLSVSVRGAKGVFYANGLVFVTTDNGYFHTFSSNLDDKKTYKFGKAIKDIQGATNYIVIAGERDIFALQNSGDLRAAKHISAPSPFVKIDVRGDKIFAVTVKNADGMLRTYTYLLAL